MEPTYEDLLNENKILKIKLDALQPNHKKIEKVYKVCIMENFFCIKLQYKIIEFLNKNDAVSYAYSLAKEYVQKNNRLPNENKSTILNKSYIYEWSENWSKKIWTTYLIRVYMDYPNYYQYT